MLLSRSEELKTKLAGGMIAIAVEAAFVGVLLFGLAVKYVKPPHTQLATYNVPDTVILQPPPKTVQPPLKKLTPDMPLPPFIDVLKTPLSDVPRVGPTLVPDDPGVTPGLGDVTRDLPEPVIVTPEPILSSAAIDRRYLATLQPSYPAAARRAEMEGRVELLVLVGVDGRIKQAEVKRSSGHDILDQAALQHALKTWRLKPATRDGIIVEGWLTVPVKFELKQS
jgi:periplasmic protein TonB